MGLTQKLGTIPLAIQTDSSNNVGIGGAANASYKLAVTGASLFTGAATFSSSVTASGSFISNVTNGYGLRLNRSAVTNYNGISHATAGVEKWFVGMRENLSSNNYVIYNEATGADALTISTSNNNVGIGTSSPSYSLDVTPNNSTFAARIRNLNTTTDNAGLLVQAGVNAGNEVLLCKKADGTNRFVVDANGTIGGYSSGADANYQPVYIMIYSGNNNETNAISTAVSSIAGSSGFRFDVSNGGGSTSRTASMYINRTSVTVVGSLSKGSGSFKIDHPLESMKDTHHLVHSFVESPQANNIYRGKVQLIDGKAEVNLDEVSTMTEGTFVLLNREIHTYTSNETDWDAVRGKVEGNILTIECQNNQSNAIVSWLVIGERQDKHMMDTEWTDDNGKVIVEPLKVTALENK